MTKILGLTGGIASGKSTVSNFFKEQNIPVVDADEVAHAVMEAGQPAVDEIREVFGEEYILDNGEINREALGKTVFSSPSHRKQLNKIVHGEIRKRMLEEREQLVAEGYFLIVLDIPLLFEADYDHEVDEVMVVYVDKDTQKERLLKRNPKLSDSEALDRIYSQMPLDDKAKAADTIIDNTGTIEQTLKQVKQWFEATIQ